MVLTLPIPEFKVKAISFYIIFADNHRKPHQFAYEFYKRTASKVLDIKKAIFGEYKIPPEQIRINLYREKKVICTFDDNDSVLQVYKSCKSIQLN